MSVHPHCPPRLTVITPNLNQGHYLEQTLCSVLDQGYENLEFMVTDGGSTDGSIQLTRLYENQLSCWRSGPDAGPASAVNWALSRAQGELVVILPSHDLLLPGALQTAVDYFAAAETADWVIGRARSIGTADQPLGPVITEDWAKALLTSHSAKAGSADHSNHAGYAGHADHTTRTCDADQVVGTSARLTTPLAACCFRRSVFEALGPLVDSPVTDFASHWLGRVIEAGYQPAQLGATIAAVRDLTTHPPDRSAAQPAVRINTEVCRGIAWNIEKRAA